MIGGRGLLSRQGEEMGRGPMHAELYVAVQLELPRGLPVFHRVVEPTTPVAGKIRMFGLAKRGKTGLQQAGKGL